MRENRLSGSEGGGTKPIVSPYPYYQSANELKQDYALAIVAATASLDLHRTAKATAARKNATRDIRVKEVSEKAVRKIG